MKKKTLPKKFAFACVILILVLIIVFSGLQILESTVFPQQEEYIAPSKTITIDGIDYFPRQDITVFLLMGIDQEGPVQDSGSYNNPGAADMVSLLIFDEKSEQCNVLQLNRDTMLEMPVLGIGGKQAGTYYGQLALAHTYGSGLEDSCENTRAAVSDFLNGIHIDYYLAMNMDAVQVLNDAVGGVTVTVDEDFSDVDPTITQGEMTLYGEQAIHYVRTRKDVGDQLNLTRMDRQIQYIDGFVAAFRNKQESDSGFILSAYEEVAPYLVSNCSVNTISGMVERYQDYEIHETVTPEGENILGEKYFVQSHYQILEYFSHLPSPGL